jgi:preprotein translocase subunit YajC
MSALPGIVLLQADGGAAPAPCGDATAFFPMILIFLIFYLLLIRPQMRRQKEHDRMLKSLEKGDRVVTSGGLHGTVTGIADDVLTLEIANVKGERLRVKIDRPRIERKLPKPKGGEAS